MRSFLGGIWQTAGNGRYPQRCRHKPGYPLRPRQLSSSNVHISLVSSMLSKTNPRRWTRSDPSHCSLIRFAGGNLTKYSFCAILETANGFAPVGRTLPLTPSRKRGVVRVVSGPEAIRTPSVPISGRVLCPLEIQGQVRAADRIRTGSPGLLMPVVSARHGGYG